MLLRTTLLTLTLAAVPAGAPADLRGVVESGRVEILRWPDAVSYTHLTLPTICSV